MDGHDCDTGARVAAIIVHDEAYMLQKLTQSFIFFHCACEFAEVFEAARCLGAAFGL